MTPDELEASIVFQVSAVAGFARDAGVALTHVKPHGALYNRAARDPSVAASVARAVRRCAPDAVLVGLAGSESLGAGRAAGLRVAAEAFADRAYEADGSLRSRRLPGAILADPRMAAAQALRIVEAGVVDAFDGSEIAITADTICIHGDTPGAVDYARAIRAALEGAGVEIRSLVAR
jgi:UPF0271 protein